MRQLNPRTDLLLQAQLFIGAPTLHGEQLRHAAERYLATTPDQAAPYTARLAHAAINAAAARPLQHKLAVEALSEVLAQAFKEGKTGDDDSDTEQLLEAGMRQWQQRADLK